MKTGGEARRVSFVSLVFFMCFAALGLIGGGIGFVFVHPDSVATASTMISVGVSLFPVAYIFKGAASKDSEDAAELSRRLNSSTVKASLEDIAVDVESK
jgi:cyanate permease